MDEEARQVREYLPGREPKTIREERNLKFVQTIRNHDASSNDNPRRGGQATIGLFGVPGGSQPRSPQSPHSQSPPARPQGDDRAKVIDGLTFGQWHARIRAMVSRPLLPRPPVPPVVQLRAGSFAAFVRLAERERRPVGEVMAEWLADCARLISRDELFEGSSRAMTPAMRRAVRAADERERRPRPDDEHGDYLHRCTGTGYVEITLAMEG